MVLTDNATFPLPESDYKNGKLRTVRGRMLKKLLKYEFQAVKKPLTIVLAILLALTTILCLFVRIDVDAMFNNEQLETTWETFTVLTAISYIYVLFAVVFVPFGISLNRFDKNFFKEEGYLTFSIPASAEEQLLAKHISGVITTLISLAANFISFVLVVLVCLTGGVSVEPSDPTQIDYVSEILTFIENTLIFLEVIIGVFTVSGAIDCFVRKFKKKWKWVVSAILAYAVILVLEFVGAIVEKSGGYDFFYFDPVGIHVGAWIQIILFAAIIAVSWYYEVYTLKRNLNLV